MALSNLRQLDVLPLNKFFFNKARVSLNSVTQIFLSRYLSIHIPIFIEPSFQGDELYYYEPVLCTIYEKLFLMYSGKTYTSMEDQSKTQ